MNALKHALRRLAKSPLFTIIAVATLALAIGINTAVFSMLDGFLLSALPYPHPDGGNRMSTRLRAGQLAILRGSSPRSREGTARSLHARRTPPYEARTDILEE